MKFLVGILVLVMAIAVFPVASYSQSGSLTFECRSSYGTNQYFADTAFPFPRKCIASMKFEKRDPASNRLLGYVKHTFACQIPANEFSCSVNETPYGWSSTGVDYRPVEYLGGEGLSPQDAHFGGCVRQEDMSGYGGLYQNGQQEFTVAHKYQCDF